MNQGRRDGDSETETRGESTLQTTL